MKVLSFFLIIVVVFQSCTTNNAEPIFINRSLDDFDLSSFYAKLDINSDMTFADQHEHINSVIEQEFQASNIWDLDQSSQFKNELVSYFVDGDANAFNNSKVINVSSSFLNLVNDFVLDMKSVESEEDISLVAKKIRNSIGNLNLSETESVAIMKMADTYEGLTKALLLKYSYDDNSELTQRAWVKCKWYQWACVGGMTAAAVALIVASAGTALAPIIAGGATVTMVAACCFCRCRCSFTDSCQ